MSPSLPTSFHVMVYTQQVLNTLQNCRGTLG